MGLIVAKQDFSHDMLVKVIEYDLNNLGVCDPIDIKIHVSIKAVMPADLPRLKKRQACCTRDSLNEAGHLVTI
jgi:hypothetical protein